jgi:integrase
LKTLTDAVLARAAVKLKDSLTFDSEIPGYALKVTPSGRRVLLVQYWSPIEHGKRRRVTIGDVGSPVLLPDGTPATLTAFTGRKIARAIRGAVDSGKDPFLDRRTRTRDASEAIQSARAVAATQRTVTEVIDSFLADAVARALRPKTVREWRRLLGKHVIPVLGAHPISAVGRSEAAQLRATLPRGRGVLSNRVQAVCCSLFNFAEEQRAGMTNPFVAGKRGANRWHREEMTRQPFTRDELARIFAALDAHENGERGGAVDVIRFLALTGWRKGEALALRWNSLDFVSGMAVLRETKTGRSERALSPNAIALLNEIPERGPYVFPSPVIRDAPRQEVRKTWDRVRSHAGVDKPLHALRHAAATIALSEGVPLATVGALLGHRNPATTLRYAKTEQRAAQEAAITLGAAIASTTVSAKVLPISSKQRAR